MILKVIKAYFSEPAIWLYIAIAVGLGYVVVVRGYLAEYWYLALVLIVVAPFYEWIAHKYLLHDRIGNVFEVEAQKGVSVGDTLVIEVLNQPQEVEVLSVSGDKMTVGYGKGKKLKWLRDFMDRLHFGHHEDPNNIKLIFAPVSASLLLFAKFFILSYVLSLFNIGVALTFTFFVVLYYLHYEWMHLAHHIPGYKHIFPWSEKLKQAHLFHHYRNENYWWGITNSLGDIILGTYPDYKEVEMSKTVMNINHKPKLKSKQKKKKS